MIFILDDDHLALIFIFQFFFCACFYSWTGCHLQIYEKLTELSKEKTTIWIHRILFTYQPTKWQHKIKISVFFAISLFKFYLFRIFFCVNFIKQCVVKARLSNNVWINVNTNRWNNICFYRIVNVRVSIVCDPPFHLRLSASLNWLTLIEFFGWFE